jgi:excisionase family DNA binding protein
LVIKMGDLKIFTLDEVSKALGVTKFTLRKYIKEGKLSAQKVGGRWLISQEAISQFFLKPYSEKKSK